MLPCFGTCACFSTSFWKIHGWLPRQALRRRMVGMASFMRRLSPAAPPAAPAPRGAALRDDCLVGVASAASFCGCWLLVAVGCPQERRKPRAFPPAGASVTGSPHARGRRVWTLWKQPGHTLPRPEPCITPICRHPCRMHLDTPEPQLDPAAQRKADRARLLRALKASLAFVLLLVVMFAAQQAMDWRAFAVLPQSAAGLVGVLTAPLLHGSPEHLGANAVSLLLLGTLAGAVYPRATVRALPLLWLGSGLGAWLLGEAG